MHGGIAIAQAQQRIARGHESVDLIAAILFGGLNVTQGTFSCAFLGMHLGLQGINRRIRGGQFLCRVERRNGLLEAAHAV